MRVFTNRNALAVESAQPGTFPTYILMSASEPILSSEEVERVNAVCSRVYEISDRIAARFTAEFERLTRDDPEAIADKRWGFTDQSGTVNFERGPIKYAVHARRHMRLKLHYLPYLKTFRRAFDVGVGTGQIFVLLRDALNIEVTGLDAADAEGAFIYRDFRQALGIADAVQLTHVAAHKDVPIPAGASVLCLWPVFDRGWGVEEHAWFVDLCRRRGAEQLVWRFNMRNAPEPILAFYRQEMGATAPRENDPGFLIVEF